VFPGPVIPPETLNQIELTDPTVFLLLPDREAFSFRAIMKRRSFLSLSALSAVPVVTQAADEAPEPDWYETVNLDGMEFRCSDADGSVVFEVELFKPAESDIKEATDSKGEHLHYLYKGKPQPYGFRPGVNLIRRFDLNWDGKAVPIPERFWNDLPDLRIATSTLKPETLKPELRWKAEEFLERLRQPRVSLSAEGGTVLIEWERGEECDSHSTIRWIVSKSGVVLRHRHCPPHEC
jgi:hypothetical protein